MAPFYMPEIKFRTDIQRTPAQLAALREVTRRMKRVRKILERMAQAQAR